MPALKIHHLYLSEGHNYKGHHGMPAGTHEIIEKDQLELVAGSGIVGDRFYDYKPDYKGQITFFDYDFSQRVAREIVKAPLCPSAFRRNVITSGIDLYSLIGKEFTIGEVRFFGHSECTPCYWMDQACAPGTEEFLKDRGGLRAKILTSGILGKGNLQISL